MSPRVARARKPAATAASLHRRLASLSVEASEVLCALHAQHRRWAFGRDDDAFWFEVAVAPRHVFAQRVAVIVDGRAGELAIHHTRQAEPIGELDWSDYSGTARLTAWTLAHRRAMTRLTQVFRGIVLPQALVDDDHADVADLVALGFRLGVGEEVTDEGVLKLAPSIARRLLTRTDVAHPQRPLAALAALPMTVRVTLRGPELVLAELRGLEPGDVIVLGARAQALGQLDVRIADAPSNAWRATWHEGRVRIDGAVDPFTESLRSTTMADSDEPTPEAGVAATAPAADPLAQLPVRIDFTLGELELPLSRLSQLEPGYVFSLVDTLDNASIGIRANGRQVGRGRLVAIGDTLGVQLEGWESDGLQ